MDAAKPCQWIGNLARDADYTVIIAPETRGVLAGMTSALERAGVESLGCSARAIELAGNKARLAEWLGARGISTPSCRTVKPSLGLPDDASYPAVLKPLDGAGSVETFLVSNTSDVPPSARTMPVALLQPYQAGLPMSASFFVGADRAWLIGIGRQRMIIEGGRFVYQGGEIPVPCEPAEALLREAIESLEGLRGFVGVDFVWETETGVIHVLEVNPRATTSFVGLSGLLPPGHLAACWLASCGVPGYDGELLVTLAENVRRQSPVSFDANGTVRPVARKEVTS